ncbi:MAG: sigma-70 family RNA polymerase sigma factor [Blautia caecimuris]
METIISLIQKQRAGDVQAAQEICRRMSPLLKKYAARLYCMEYDDAMQELYIALLETFPYLDPAKTEAECLNYIQTTVHNRYRFLCRGCLSVPQSESIEDSIDTLSAPSPFDESYYDICNYIKALPEKGMRRQIMSLCFFQYKTDSEIAEQLHVSRQYVNRIKKQLITEYFSER